MIELSDVQSYGALGALLVFATLVVTVQNIIKNAKKDRTERDAIILQSAKESDSKMRADLEAKISALSVKLETLETTIQSDINHLKSAYTSEIRYLGEKIETLRIELSSQNGALLELLTKFVGKK